MILGAAGFIGTNLTLRLLDYHKKLILFDKSKSVYIRKIQNAVMDGQVSIREGSFTDMELGDWYKVIPELEEVETVYHLISTTCPTNSNRNIAAEIEENLISTIHFLDACVQAKVKKVVFLSSGGTVYGKEHTGLCREEEEAFPITVYGMQKLSIEKALYLYWNIYGLDYRIVRLSNPYGPYQRPNGIQGVVTTFTWNALNGLPVSVYGDGSVIRDYIYIDDAIEGILKIAESNGSYRLYNLGSGKGFSVLQVIALLKEKISKELKVQFLNGRKVDVPINILDISRYQMDFGEFKPIHLSEGIDRLIYYFSSKPE